MLIFLHLFHWYCFCFCFACRLVGWMVESVRSSSRNSASKHNICIRSGHLTSCTHQWISKSKYSNPGEKARRTWWRTSIWTLCLSRGVGGPGLWVWEKKNEKKKQFSFWSITQIFIRMHVLGPFNKSQRPRIPRKVNVFPFLFPRLSRLNYAIENLFYSVIACNSLCSVLSILISLAAHNSRTNDVVVRKKETRKNSPQTQLVVLSELCQLLE